VISAVNFARENDLLSKFEAYFPTHGLSGYLTDRLAGFQVAYGSDVPAVLALLAEIAGRHPRVLRDPAPVAQVVDLADSGINLELGLWIGDPEGGSQNVRSDVLVQVLSEFRARGIEIPFPQRDVRVLAGEFPKA